MEYFFLLGVAVQIYGRFFFYLCAITLLHVTSLPAYMYKEKKSWSEEVGRKVSISRMRLVEERFGFQNTYAA